jgi:hypothetical protein
MKQKLSNFSHGSQTHWFKVYEIDIMNFIMVKNDFDFLKNIYSFNT